MVFGKANLWWYAVNLLLLHGVRSEQHFAPKQPLGVSAFPYEFEEPDFYTYEEQTAVPGDVSKGGYDSNVKQGSDSDAFDLGYGSASSETAFDLGSEGVYELSFGSVSDLGSETTSADLAYGSPSDVAYGRDSDLGSENGFDQSSDSTSDLGYGSAYDLGSDKASELAYGSASTDLGSESVSDLGSASVSDLGSTSENEESFTSTSPMLHPIKSICGAHSETGRLERRSLREFVGWLKVWNSVNRVIGRIANGKNAVPGESCAREVKECKESKYRSIDGTCNNQKHPTWGAPGTPYGRLLPPHYSDGVHAPAKSVTGEDLPNSRLLSRTFFPGHHKSNYKWSVAFMQWGQIMTHDMSLGMESLRNTGCCGLLAPLKTQSKNEPCYAIPLAMDDRLRKEHGQTCLDFTRTSTDHYKGCPSGKAANPLSSVTHWLDGSLVYGSDEKTANEIRLHQGGRLRSEFRNGEEWPPMEHSVLVTRCLKPAPLQVCYKTGDPRGNQNAQLTLLQVILLREHNRVADALAEINKHWNDEILYQEARRIVIAIIQHISYYEWLSDLFGKKISKDAGITYKGAKSFINDYDDSVNPSVLNEHAHAAFRYLHTSIRGKIALMSEQRYNIGHIRLSEHMLDPQVLESGAFQDLARGMTAQRQNDFDNYITNETTEYLFRTKDDPRHGHDLRSLDIHRGRDHGLPPYNAYRERCGLPKAVKFSDFADVMEKENAEKLSTIYKHPDDVDLVVGASLETVKDPPLTGPTFNSIIKEQFRRTRIADRFFYESGGHKGAFTLEQLNELRKATFARLMCDNSNGIKRMQPRAFIVLDPEKDNVLKSCDDYEGIPAIDLRLWKE